MKPKQTCIFLRNTRYLKSWWLCSKNAGKVDANGSEYACGGRKERAVQDALLIVKLIQDYSKWTKKQIIIEFLQKYITTESRKYYRIDNENTTTFYRHHL